MSHKEARRLYPRAVRQATRNMANLASIGRADNDERLECVVQATAKALKALEKPQRRLPEVEAWSDQWQSLQHRYKFLVLDGPTRTGESMFAKALAGHERTLDLTCSGCNYPDMRAFDYFVHQVVLFDEASVDLVLSQKRLFQTPPSFVDMGGSATNVHAYRVWVHGTKLVVTSNKWQQQKASLPEEDQSWLDCNSVYVFVDRALWGTESSETPSTPEANHSADVFPEEASDNDVNPDDLDFLGFCEM